VIAALEAEICNGLADPESLAAALRAFVASGRLAAVIHDVMAAQQRNAFSAGEDGIDEGALVLARSPRFVLSAQTVHRAADHLQICGTDNLVALVSSTPVMVSRYRIAADVDLDVFEPGAPLAMLDRRPHDGEPIWQRRTDRIAYDYESAAPFVKLCLGLRPSAGQRWLFDRSTLRASYPVLESAEASGSITLCQMVAALTERRALPMLLELTEHASHAVRWSAIQAVGKLNGREGRRLLGRAVTDAHPHIRAAASRALARLAAAPP
jgi:hypothetical protein